MRDFKKDFPESLRPSVSDRLNFNFQVRTGRNGQTGYFLQGMEAYGVCRLYQQALIFEAQTLPMALAEIRAVQQRESAQRRQQQNLSDKFQ